MPKNGSTIVPSRFTTVPPNSTQNARGSPPILDWRKDGSKEDEGGEGGAVTVTRPPWTTGREACESFSGG
ncbi:hypothetical protein Aph01nite_38860 [Acrocarpospora phusangensis]|uniref:Uncharacterized protein n=1 Tax=Acrocarpospora phusangensis TaxID=1070424 RepID=A0A919UKZ4_9ACTN|nr:hypothetical protein Aph01nite_38860 [Acrocarpospora phusangensis]